ncbi:hypothetical protein KUD11_04410 [Roseovarius sp. LXJ103]|uniref:hypothetical protein n=1 Tax=Roseovarius carneus TaxID=2853164 RepID=UPI001CCA7F0E|nr:hypothetical protein [Roseovarius carneus]MBZ8117883.1 hypothetical protein [Roseovarius carneus]
MSTISRILQKKSISGKHEFIAIFCDLKDQDKDLDRLTGIVYPILNTERKSDWRSQQLINQIRSCLAELSRSPIVDSQQKKLTELQSKIELDLTPYCPIAVGFDICRNGIVKFKPVRLKKGLVQDFDKDEKSVQDYTEQAFFFLRDITHIHQHHEPESDTIIRVHKQSPRAVKDIYFDLFRYIIRFKRFRSPENIMRASGILAYANSFKLIQADQKQLPNDYQIENLKMSLEAAQFELQYEAQRQNGKISLALTIVFSVFGLLLSLSALAQFAPVESQKQIVPSGILVAFTAWIAENPVWFAGFGFAIGYLSLLLAGRVKPNQYPTFENVLRLFNHSSKLAFLLPVILLGLTLLGIAIWIFKISLTH